MKKWVQKTAGLVMSVFLALGLGARVHAADEEESLPAPAPVEEVQPAPAPAAEAPKPAESKPAEPKPAESKPAESKPAETKPTESKPAETKPAESKPAESKPAETKPAESKPAESKPAESKPAETKPAESKPAETAPAESKPTESKPVEQPGPTEQAPAAEASRPDTPAPAAGSKPADPSPAEQDKPAETVPPEAEKPAETAPAAEEKPSGASVPVEQPAPVGQSAPAEMPVPTVEDTPVEGTASVEASSPVQALVPAEETAPVEGSAPAEAPDPVGEEVPVEGAASAEAPSPVEELALTEEPSSDDGADPVEKPASEVTVPVDGSGILSSGIEITAEQAMTRSAAPAMAASVPGDDAESDLPSRSLAKGSDNAQTSDITVGGKDVLEQDGWTYNESTGQIGLINYDHAEIDIVSSGLTGLNIATAGFNHLGTLSSEGDIHITGTGILLLDDVSLGENSGFYLHTFTDLYKDGTGSAAVFLRQYDNLYMMVNGSVPGILDEEYIIRNADLLIPSGSTLLMDSGSTALDRETGEVVGNWHGGEKRPDGFNANIYKMLSSVSSIDLEDNASLTVEEGAAIETISPEGPPPSISAKGNGAITVDGSATGRLNIELSEGSSLTGSGSIRAQKIKISSPDNIASCGVTLQAEIHIKGSGPIKTLKLKDSLVFYDQEHDTHPRLTIGSLSNSGDSVIVSPERLTIHKITNSGTLLFSCSTDLENGPDTDLTGPVSGGEIRLGKGFFRLAPGFSLKNGASLKYENVIVYDYSKSTAFSAAPLTASSSTVRRPTLDGSGRYVVPLVVFEEVYEFFYHNSYSVVTMSDVDLTEAYAYKGGDGGYVIDLGAKKTFRDNESPIPADSILKIEAYSMDTQGNLSVTDIAWAPSLGTPLPSLPLNDIYLVRVIIADNRQVVQPLVSYAPTSTSYTGSGVLGGSGSANAGTGSPIMLRRIQKPEDNHDPEKPNPDPEPEPQPVDPDPVVPDSVVPDSAPESAAPAAPRNDLRVIVTLQKSKNTLRVYNGTKEITDLGGQKVTARVKFSLPAGWNKNAIFAVFRNADGSLTAFKAVYDAKTGELTFDTDLTGTFTLVSFPFNGDLFSEEFYKALARLDEIRILPVRR